MIELKQNNIWSDSLNSFLNFDEPWNYIDKELHKFICFAGAGGEGDGADGSDAYNPDFGFDIDLAIAPPLGAPTGPLGGDPSSKSQSDDTGLSDSARDALSGAERGLGTARGSMPQFAGNVFGDNQRGLDPGELGQYGQDPFGGLSVGHLGRGLAGIPSGRPRGPGDLALNDIELLGTTFNRFGEFVDFSLPELFVDAIEVAPFGSLIGTAVRGVASLVDEDNNLGLNTANPIEQVSSVLGFVSPDVQTTLDTFSDRAETAISDAIFGEDTSSPLGSTSTDTVDASTPPTSSLSTSTSVDDFNFDADGSPDPRRPRGIASVVQNPLEVRPKEEVQPSSGFRSSRIVTGKQN